MNVTAIDTHSVVKRLMAAGFTDAQAEAVTLVVRDAQDIDLSNLVTKADLAATKADLEKSMAEVKVDLASTKVEILNWMVSTMGIQTVVMIGAIVTLVRLLH